MRNQNDQEELQVILQEQFREFYKVTHQEWQELWMKVPESSRYTEAERIFPLPDKLRTGKPPGEISKDRTRSNPVREVLRSHGGSKATSLVESLQGSRRIAEDPFLVASSGAPRPATGSGEPEKSRREVDKRQTDFERNFRVPRASDFPRETERDDEGKSPVRS